MKKNNREEMIYLYDVKDANPNGDVLDDNKPRIDEETGINLVTDVRLKRTIRDYFIEYKGYNGENDKDVFVRQIFDEKGDLRTGKLRADDFKKNPQEVLDKAIDIRLFGGVIPLEKETVQSSDENNKNNKKIKKGDSITFTGPVQFSMGRSLNRVNVRYIQGTGAFASKDGAKQNTFRTEYIVDYSLIGFYGIINEKAGKYTNLSEEDVELLYEGVWNGTKNLISRSKIGQMPRLLIRIIYKENENGFFIGDLKSKIKMVPNVSEEKIRGTKDYIIDISDLIECLEKYSDKILKVVYSIDDNLKLNQDIKTIKNIVVEEFVY